MLCDKMKRWHRCVDESSVEFDMHRSQLFCLLSFRGRDTPTSTYFVFLFCFKLVRYI